MASFRAGFDEPVIATPGAADLKKYRLSCDRCQNTKVRCSQDKPACRRCVQRGVLCVYSPLRRIGRPRKVSGGDAVSNERSSVSMTPSPGDTSAASLGDSGYQSDFAMADIQMMDAQARNSSPHPVLPPNGNGEPLHSAVPSRRSDHQFSIVAQSHESQNYAAGGADMRTAEFHGEPNYAHASTSTPDSAPEPQSGADCYTAILTQTANLVQALARTALPLGIDVVFEAERDFCALQHRLFTCTGHGLPPQQQQLGSDPNFVSLQSTNCRDRPCLASDRPVLLNLALQAEHVIGMLEDLFRLASQAAHALDKTDLGFSWPGSGGQDSGLVGPLARRLQRSCRTLWATPCVSPLVEASRDLRLGDFLVENPAKSKAMRRILTLRVDQMLQALQGMKRSRWRGERDDRRALDVPLHWGGSASLMSDLADTLLDDLIRRVETLQGAMVLIRNDTLI